MMLGASLELTDSLKDLLKQTAERLKGTERRQFMAQVVQGGNVPDGLLSSVESLPGQSSSSFSNISETLPFCVG